MWSLKSWESLEWDRRRNIIGHMPQWKRMGESEEDLATFLVLESEPRIKLWKSIRKRVTARKSKVL